MRKGEERNKRQELQVSGYIRMSFRRPAGILRIGGGMSGSQSGTVKIKLDPSAQGRRQTVVFSSALYPRGRRKTGEGGTGRYGLGGI